MAKGRRRKNGAHKEMTWPPDSDLMSNKTDKMKMKLHDIKSEPPDTKIECDLNCIKCKKSKHT